MKEDTASVFSIRHLNLTGLRIYVDGDSLTAPSAVVNIFEYTVLIIATAESSPRTSNLVLPLSVFEIESRMVELFS